MSTGAGGGGAGDANAHVIGLISDTHGLVRPGVHDALAGVAIILHAGDVGGDDVLDELETIAPVLAVYGNTDPPGWPRVRQSVVHRAGGLVVHVSHGHELGSPTPAKLLERYAADVIVYGHTHRQLVARAAGRLVVNPGAAGPRRFDMVPSVARLVIAGGAATVEVVPLAG
jgi:putative phosphoesterase